MSYSPPFKLTKFVELFYEQDDQYNILAGDVLASPKIFKRWKITTDGLSPVIPTMSTRKLLSTKIQRTAGVGNVQLSFAQSADGITYVTINSIASSSAVLAANAAAAAQATLPVGAVYLALIAFNSDGATTGLIKQFNFHALILPPRNYHVDISPF